jgi:hypothetical protein
VRPVRESNSRRHAFGLYRGKGAAAVWFHVDVLGRWWGIEVRWDPDVMGSKAMWTVAGHDIGWLD